MRCARASTLALFLGVCTGCGGGASTEPQPTGAVSEDLFSPDMLDASLVRGTKEPVLLPENAKLSLLPPARHGDIALPEDGGAWPWDLSPAPPPQPTRPVSITGVTLPDCT